MASQAFTEWLETFKSYDAEELADHIENLKSQISIFSSQGVGTKNFTRDLNELRSQLAAATRARSEKSQGRNNSGVTDFSCVNAEGDIHGRAPELPTSYNN